jgi:basic membrane protein A
VTVNRKFARALAVLALVLAAAFVAACGSDNSSSSSSSSGNATATPAGKKIKVGLVTDTGGLNDRSFNHLAYVGLQRAQKELGVDIRVLTSTKNSDYVPNLTSLARQKYDLIVANGFLMAAATEKVANAFPTSTFAIIDSAQADMKSKPKNVIGLLFKEQEPGYIVGYIAGLYAKDKGGKQVISSVGGLKIPPVDHYIAGYQAGAKAANPKIKALNAYSQDFNAADKCKELALNQIAAGSQVVFQVAGGCGLGALDAAKEKGVQGIGVDADQSYLGPHIMVSALKKVDVAVFDTAKAVQAGSAKGGTDVLFDVKAGAAGFGKLNAEGAKFQAQAEQIEQKIKSGEISNIPNTVK